ncbi:hypothetical protein CC2G_008412 [Coprinopsis cinerea AmutBmut pab1-1]|nr:hypothetical protein CC2G_008412 [Coprinopsis cinerea AmutBmut pab1-1]
MEGTIPPNQVHIRRPPPSLPELDNLFFVKALYEAPPDCELVVFQLPFWRKDFEIYPSPYPYLGSVLSTLRVTKGPVIILQQAWAPNDAPLRTLMWVTPGLCPPSQ